MSEHSAENDACPTCGPTAVEQHPRRPAVTRCANCKEWLRSPEIDAAPVGDRVRWFMARAWDEGLRAGHDCVGTEAKPSCSQGNPYRVTPPAKTGAAR